MLEKAQLKTIIGLQYGDEGKGKFSNLLASDYDYIVRYQGGDNAGHSIQLENQRFQLKIIPAGIFNHQKVVIANGCVLNPKILLEEIAYLEKHHISVHKRLFISERAHIIFDFHRQFDELNENLGAQKAQAIGTTKRGIGPCYADKINRIGIRFSDLYSNYQLLVNKITNSLYYKNILFKYHQYPLFDPQKVAQEYWQLGQKLKEYSAKTSLLLNEALEKKQKLLLEGAQGLFLDLDFGTYPYVTSSNIINVAAATGISRKYFQSTLGIAKAYATRVGEGPFSSEIFSATAEYIREKGHEYGTNTLRARRIGWIDLVALKAAINLSGVDQLALTLVDVLSGIKTLKLVIAYQFQGQKIDYVPSNNQDYQNCEALYYLQEGWDEEISKVKNWADLPKNCQKYVRFISNYLKIPITYLSLGPEKRQTIHAPKGFQ